MSDSGYIHGFDAGEQRRLVTQAKYWRDALLLRGVNYRAGEKLLEIGCATGATLGELGRAFPGLQLSGIDLESKQIDFARQHLAGLGLKDADLRVGNASSLPWPNGCFDHVYIIWFLEHVKDAMPVVREAHRVLKPGGTITLTEADYTSFRIHPTTDDYNYLRQGQYDIFNHFGNPIAGQQLGSFLVNGGFDHVKNHPVGFHFFNQAGNNRLRRHVEYVSDFLHEEIERMVSALGLDRSRLERGRDAFCSIPDHPHGSITQLVFRANGVKG